MVTVPFAPLEKDKSRYNINALSSAINAIPAPDGWAPLKSEQTVTAVYDYITDRAYNRLTDNQGNRLVTGAANLDFLLDEDDLLLTDENDVSLVVGASGTALSGSPVLPDACTGLFAARKQNGQERIFSGSDTKLRELNRTSYLWANVSGMTYDGACRWSFAKFGDVVYAQNGADPEQMIDLETDTLFSDNATAPVCKYIAVVGDFLFRGNIENSPLQIQWSSINDPQANVATVNMSDYQDLPTGDEVMGFAPVTQGVFVILRSSVHLMSFALETAYRFTRTTVDEMKGVSAPYSIVVIGQNDWIAYFDDGFWRYRGGQFQPVGHTKMNAWFLANSDPDERENMLGMVDPERDMVWFSYTSTSGTRKMIGYQYNLDRWCESSVSAQASARMRTFAYSVGGTALMTDDQLKFTIITEDGTLAYLEGPNLQATIETHEISFSGTNRSFVNGLRLDSDATDYTVTTETADKKGGTFRARSAASPGARTGFVSTRADGRVHKFTTVIAAGDDWTTASGLDVDVQGAGK